MSLKWHQLSHDTSLRWQGVRFVLVGSLSAFVYLSTTTALAVLAGLPFQVALAIGSCLALLVHFTLQRRFVWGHNEEFALSVNHQVGRYLLLAGVQYVVTALSVGLLPPVLGLPTEVVYLATAVLAASANFVLFRNGIFHPPAKAPGPVSAMPQKTPVAAE